MIAVDSSVWIDAFRGDETPQVEACRRLIGAGAPVAVPDVVLTEVLRGARDDRQEAEMSDRLLSLPILRLQGPGGFVGAARLSRVARSAGITIGSTIDLLIAAVCISEDASLLHADADFDRLATCTPLKVLPLG